MQLVFFFNPKSNKYVMKDKRNDFEQVHNSKAKMLFFK